jgi:hypothetical protein
MLSQFRMSFLAPLLPVTAAGMLLQALAGLYYPQSEIGSQFLLSLETLFTTEFVLMHSAVFFEGRRVIKRVWLQYTAATLLFFAYGLFILPLMKHNPWIGINYAMLTFSRLLTYSNPIENTDFFRSLDDGAKKLVPAMLALLKAGGVFFGIPLLLFIIPLPAGNLTVDEVMRLFPAHKAPQDFIFFAKAFAVYFLIMTSLDIRKTLMKFTQPKTEEKNTFKSNKPKKAA